MAGRQPSRPRSLVTGGATGIGAATVRLLAARGDEVAVHYRSHPAEAATLVSEISAAGGQAWSVKADLRAPADLDHLSQEVARRFPSLDSLVLNAGEYPRRRLEELTYAQFEETLRVNLLAPFEIVRTLLPLLRRSAAPPARVVMVSSVLALQGSEHGADYAASKAGLLGLAKSLARELAPGVLVNVVAPGTIDTAIMAHENAEQKAARSKRIPLARIGTAEEVAKVVAFLASPSANYMTGTTVHVNGGLRMD